MDHSNSKDQFQRYYDELSFKALPRASMLHPSIPMSFVMSAGLIQIESSLKKNEIKAGDKYLLVQDCFRHFDKKKVAKQPNHLSLFEMSGAFEFGSFDQADIIAKLWTLVVAQIGVDRNRIWATYFEGGRIGQDYIESDTKSRDTWKKLGIKEDYIVGLGKEDNFWMQGGDVLNERISKRKCGPNSELFFDKGEAFKCTASCRPGCRCGRFIEFANILFVQYELLEGQDRLKKLDLPFAETVMGNERMAMILESKNNVFDIAPYRELRHFSSSFLPDRHSSNDFIYQNINVVLDHMRAIQLLISDGAPPPGRGGRSHIMKGLIRGVLARLIVLGIPFDQFIGPIQHKISDVFQSSLENDNSPIHSRVIDYFRMDAERFNKTLQTGQKHILNLLRENPEGSLSDQNIKFIEKKLGVPPVIINEIVKTNGISL